MTGVQTCALPIFRTWTGGAGDKKWSSVNNWTDNTVPVSGDTAIIPATKDVEVDGAPAEAKVVELGEGAKLTIKSDKLSLDDGGELRVSGNATVATEMENGLEFSTLNKIVVAAGKTLTLNPAANLDIRASVTGNLNVEMADVNGKKISLHEDVVGKVGFKAPADPAKEATLEINRSMVAAVDFTAADGTPKLKLYGGSEIGTLNAVDGLVILSDGLADNTIHFLAPAADATLKIEGTRRLSILDGTKDVKWNVEVQLLFSAEFALTGKNLLTGEVTVTLNRGTLILPSGKFDGLTLKARDYSNLLVDVAAQDPVLTVKEKIGRAHV